MSKDCKQGIKYSCEVMWECPYDEGHVTSLTGSFTKKSINDFFEIFVTEEHKVWASRKEGIGRICSCLPGVSTEEYIKKKVKEIEPEYLREEGGRRE